MHDWKRDRIAAAERGENPTVLARLTSGFVVFGDTQFLPGYRVLLASPRVEQLTDLSREQRQTFLDEMGIVGEAITRVCRPARINYEILGNSDHYLHAHVVPRYEWELPERRSWPVFSYPGEMWSHPQSDYANPAFGQLRSNLAGELRRLIENGTNQSVASRPL